MRWLTAVEYAEQKFEEREEFCWKTNKILIRGSLKERFIFNHNVRNEKFYMGRILTSNRRGKESIVPVIANKELIHDFKENESIEIIGEVRTFKEFTSYGNKKTVIYIFAKKIERTFLKDINVVEIEGRVEKLSFRTVTSGKIFSNILLRINRNSGIDFIDVIAWGDEFYHTLKVGDIITVKGKIQNQLVYDNNHQMNKSNKLCVIWGMQVLV